MKFQINVIIILLFYNLIAIAQTVEPAETIEKTNLEIEFEAVYSSEKENTNKNTSWDIPNISIGYGLTDNLELQLQTHFTKERCFENNELTSNVFKFEEVEIGFLVNLWKQKGIIPEAAIMARIISPTKTFNFTKLGYITSLNFSNLLSEKISLNYNIGNITNIDKNTTSFYVVNATYEPNSILHFYIETLSDFSYKKGESNCIGTGFGINLNKHFSIDLSARKNLKHRIYMAGVVLTWVVASS